MNYKRIALAAVVAWFIDAIYGVVAWMMMLGDEFARYPAVFRSQEAMSANAPLMFVGALLAMFVLAYIYAKGYEGGGMSEGMRFGVLLGLFTFGFVSIGLYGTLKIGRWIAVLASMVSFIEMILVGTVIGALYRPLARPHTTRATTAG